MAVLRVREYQSIETGSVFSAADRIVTPAEHRRLERFSESFQQSTGAPVFQHGARGRLVAQNFVGVIKLGRHQVEVLPKIEAEDAVVRCNLLRMLAATLDLPIHGDTSTQVTGADESVLEGLIRLFCAQLWTLVRRGVARRYESHRDDLPVLRGRLDVVHQLHRNVARPDRLHCIFDEFTEDTGLNRLLRAALRVLIRLARAPDTVRSVSELLFCFQDVSDLPTGSATLPTVTTDRLTEHYRPLIALARLFLRGASPDVTAGDNEGFALLFDMNVLFEEYIGRQAQAAFRAPGTQVVLQGPRRHLARSVTGGPAFQLQPDIVVLEGGRPVLVIDTKWKKLDRRSTREGVSSADAYQMHAYATRYDVRQVVLLYPHHASLGAPRAARDAYLLGGDGDGAPARWLSVGTIDLAVLSTMRAQLRDCAQEPSPAS